LLEPDDSPSDLENSSPLYFFKIKFLFMELKVHCYAIPVMQVLCYMRFLMNTTHSLLAKLCRPFLCKCLKFVEFGEIRTPTGARTAFHATAIGIYLGSRPIATNGFSVQIY